MEFFSIDFIIRISFALILGFLLGLERELTNKYAGLRTHILVCLGACIFTIISIYGFPTYAAGDNVMVEQATGVRDTARIAAQVVSGIGFIGAGAVLRNGPMIIGLTTAATLWISAAIGMTCGVGMFDVAIITTIASVAVLTVVRIFERKFIQTNTKKTRRYKIIVYCNINSAEKINDCIINNAENVEEFSSKKLVDEPEKIRISSIFEVCQKKASDDIYKKITVMVSPESITLQGLND